MLINEMSMKLFKMLSAEQQRREDQEWVASADLMADLYHGTLPQEYMKFFPKNAPTHIVQVIRNAWDDLATSIGRLPDLRADALDETVAEEKRASLLEMIGFKYMDDAEPSARLLMRMNAWWLVGTGRSVMMVRPDMDKDTPIFTYRDPRFCWPNMRTVGGVPVEIYDLLFKYKIPRLTAFEMGLAPALEKPGQVGPMGGSGAVTSQQETTVIEFIDDVAYTIVSEHGMMFRQEHNLGVVPGWVFQNFAPNTNSGISLFKDQVSLMVAISMLVTLKLAAADKQVNPIYWARGHQGTITLGPNTLTKLSANGEIGVLPPPVLQQVDSDIAQLVTFSNILNKNPEVRQGQVEGRGSYTSAKTLEQLNEAIDTVIGDYWDITSVGLKHLFMVAFKMDEKLWKNKEKRISLNVKGKTLRDVYTPKKDIAGHYDINVEYGFGVGGYQGFLQNMQANAAKMISRKTAMEAMPGVTDQAKETRQLQIEDLDDAGMALIQSQAASGQLDMKIWRMFRLGIAEGKFLHEVMKDIEEAAEAQAEQASQTEAGVAPITAPPAAPPGSIEGTDLRALPGLNPGGLA